MTPAADLTRTEIRVLEMIAGQRPGEWGAAIGVALETLRGRGLCSRGLQVTLTPAGRKTLADLPTWH